MRSITAIMSGLVAGIAFVSVAGAEVVFSDSVFPDSEWFSKMISDTAGTSSFESGQASTGGNPGEFRLTTHEYYEASMVVAHFRDGWVYDPGTSGAIEFINFSYDLKLIDDVGALSARYRLCLEQDGIVYESLAGDLIFEPIWTGFFQVAQTSVDFIPSDESLVGTNPDFSEDGAPIRIGYRTSNSATDASRHETTHGIDNFRVEVVPIEDPTPVTEVSWAGLKTRHR